MGFQWQVVMSNHEKEKDGEMCNAKDEWEDTDEEDF